MQRHIHSYQRRELLRDCHGGYVVGRRRNRHLGLLIEDESAVAVHTEPVEITSV